MSSADYSTHGAVAVLTLNNPPVNGLGHELRGAIVAGLDRALADPAVKAIVLIGAGKAFSGGADIASSTLPRRCAEPNLGSVIRAVERSPKPVVAAIHDGGMGGGLELALGCHYRVATPGAQIAFPEVKLGLLPGAGGTQRLPRVVGLETALSMIVSGTRCRRRSAEDTTCSTRSSKATCWRARSRSPTRWPTCGLCSSCANVPITDPNAQAFFALARTTVKAVREGVPGAGKVRGGGGGAATKPFEEGLGLGARVFLELVQTTESKALRHVFFAERAAAKIPDVPEGTPTRPIESAAIIGAGTMGGGIAMTFANAGIPVTVLEVKQEALDKGLAVIRKNYEGSVEEGEADAGRRSRSAWRCSSPTLDYAALGQADLVIEAVFEDMGVKKKVFRKLDEVMKPGAILATNTSTLDIDRIASFTRRPAGRDRDCTSSARRT